MKRNRPLDTRQLMAFELLAETGSFTGAAKSLFLTQSAISHSMKTLEEDLGCKLLRRHGKKVSLTDAGQHLLILLELLLVAASAHWLLNEEGFKMNLLQLFVKGRI